MINTPSPSDIFAPIDSPEPSIPIWLISDTTALSDIAGLGEEQRLWLSKLRFSGAARKQTLVPGANGGIAGVAFGIGNGKAGEPSGPSELLLGQLASTLPPGLYHLAYGTVNPHLSALAWGLGAYRFRRYKTGLVPDAPARLKLPANVDADALYNEVGAVWTGRDLINTPAADMGPAEIEDAVRMVAGRFGAEVSSIVGDDLLSQGYRMIHAVGRASPKAPRLIDLTWHKPGGRPDAPTITLVGKGISFDTGGLDIKPASAMLIMKKDMGGAAAALTLAQLIMGHGLDVRLRLLIASAENSIAGDAFRPGDILTSRAGKTVEIGNTDAEGRLVLADAISLADESSPDTLLVFATLTGAARTALGPDLPAFFTDDEALARDLAEHGASVGDPVWRLPFWPGYDRYLDSDIADMNNVSDGPFAGAITAALSSRGSSKTLADLPISISTDGGRQRAHWAPKEEKPQTARNLFAILARENGQ